ncbi:M20/M25/M40 family metallo-hydrolase [Gloeobacter kilaueensis]|uniref:Carboxypeptidase Q n=1 Tax=Gloeobacter kilaueensis (strain ATCC BAA-2537 / CCAP 1431/1 / ULC 316 / JS1) TaxID=1183438 RepID=U5QQF2_GLOK1|nr:M20/M25/M40 family metallo-hydrolase [Gloeobacter kilaueensis]AGY59834.1 peptidase M28 [Gloeobacter kilaueensis JS1]
MPRVLVFALVFIGFALPALAQPQDDLERLRRAALTSDYAYRQVAHLCNNIGLRLSGSAQAAGAVQYVAEQLRQLGLEVRLEKVSVPHWVRGVEAGTLTRYAGQVPGTSQKLALTALGGSVATPAAGLEAEVVVVQSFDALVALGREKVAGKIVLFNRPFDRQMAAQGQAGEAYGQAVIYRGGGASAAARLGAVAALVRSAGGANYRLPHTGALRYASDAPQIPAAAVAGEDADLIAALAAQGPVRLRLTLTPQSLPDIESYNVVADLKGSVHPEQVVIVSGHLDSWDLGTGAIDDAAGVAMAMQTAQLLKQLQLVPERTIRVIAWMNEENGLRGGRAYFEAHKGELANHVAAIESDFGAGHPLGIYAKANAKALERLAPAAAVLDRQGAGLIQPAQEVGADIGPLTSAGVPGFGLLQDGRTYFDYHHTAADTLDKIVPAELAENAAVMAVLAYSIANLSEALPR